MHVNTKKDTDIEREKCIAMTSGGFVITVRNNSLK
jgi:hypothetical protein